MITTKSITFQLIMACIMLLVSIFMSISYYIEITTNEADRLSKIAFYVWVISILAWLVKVIHDTRVLKNLKKGKN